ncbi:CPBP family intramembrane glutamic endopeptidase [Clostridium autoethanogenum]|uniref:CPBP family intramembrane metalloprotease n=1 Tax=Clostridium autoethanogenum DSM 10061 TaxID=1341692 RepID=A0ABM5NTV5_9CLOT|nr:CPBP family intramembrane glutamic endopeptidase [Clostridium autoethanogenum]AGY75861.2 CPBP family intramembrane metalloprotease [Clostridium autoethanogenum DSM 10061]
MSIIKAITHLNINYFWGLLNFAVVGFFEEFMFRGYLQTHLIIWLGKNKGWMISSALMVLMHLPQRIFSAGLSLSGAFTSIFYLVFFSLFLGYMMIKTENVTAPAILHTLCDWVRTLS